MVNKKAPQRVCNCFFEGIHPRLWIKPRKLKRKLLIKIHAAGSIFVEFFVAVIIAAFAQVQPLSVFAFDRVGFNQYALIVGVQHQGAVRIFNTHPTNQPVAVDILRRVFIYETIAVIIVRSQIRVALQ